MPSQEDRRSEVLAAATQWVLDHGLGTLSLRPLARDLGTSDRMLVYYFGSKDALVNEVLTEANARLTAHVVGQGHRGREDAQPLLAMWRRLSTAEAAPYLRLYFEVFGLALQQPDRYGPFLLKVHQGWLDLTAAQLSPRSPRSKAARQRATVAVAVVEGLLLDLLVTGDRARVDAAARAALPELGSAPTRGRR